MILVGPHGALVKMTLADGIKGERGLPHSSCFHPVTCPISVTLPTLCCSLCSVPKQQWKDIYV